MSTHNVSIALADRAGCVADHDFAVEIEPGVIGADLLAIGRALDAAYVLAKRTDCVVAWVSAIDGRRLEEETDWERLSEEAGA